MVDGFRTSEKLMENFSAFNALLVLPQRTEYAILKLIKHRRDFLQLALKRDRKIQDKELDCPTDPVNPDTLGLSLVRGPGVCQTVSVLKSARFEEEGKLPSKVLSLVVEWANEHKEELMENWETLRSTGQYRNIEPLV